MLTEARSDFSHAIELDGNNAKAYSNRGALLLLEARYKDALADFEQVCARTYARMLSLFTWV